MAVNLHVFVHALSYTTFVLALLTNSLFIYLILKKTSRDMGAYKYIMLCFGSFNILYSLVEFLSQPAVLIVNSSYMTYSDSFIDQHSSLCYLLLSVFMAMYGLSTILFAIHFVYRYVLICKPRRRYIFYKLKWITMWVVIALTWGIIFGGIAYYVFAPSNAFYEFAREEVLMHLNENIDNLIFFCVFTYEKIDGSTIVHWRYCIGLFCYMTMMVTTIIIIIYCGVQTTRMLRNVCMSPKTLFLHKQLLKALFVQAHTMEAVGPGELEVQRPGKPNWPDYTMLYIKCLIILFQAAIPFALCYLPRFLMFFFTLMGFQGHSFYTFVPTSVTLYTFLDPLTNMYFNPDYKRSVVTFFRRYLCCNKMRAQVHPQTYSNTVK